MLESSKITRCMAWEGLYKEESLSKGGGKKENLKKLIMIKIMINN